MAEKRTLSRRSLLTTTVAAAAAGPLAAGPQDTSPTKLKGRLKQAVCQWCYRKLPLEELARQSAAMGIRGIDLLQPQDWDTVKKFGLVPSMAYSGHEIRDGLNNKENYAKFEELLRKNMAVAAAAGVPNIIVFSGNRRGMPDEEGAENCALFLNKVKAEAEDKDVTLCLELLNSKVDHKDYMCDHTRWGVDVMKRVNSPRVKLLYDIYHMQIMEGDVIRTIRENIQYIGHFHTGGVPGRNEIDGGQELNYAAISKAIVEAGYTGYLAHEFVPKREPLVSLREAVLLCDV